jgi:hypothetical protein
MSKAGKGDSVDTGSVGSQHPVPEDIPHLSSPVSGPGGGGGGTGAAMLLPAHHHHHLLHGNGGSGLQQAAGSPVKESSFLGREMVAGEEGEGKEEQGEQQREGQAQAQAQAQAVATQVGGLPLRG